MSVGPWCDSSLSLHRPDLVNKRHPLLRGRVGWWMAPPGLRGGGVLYDLMGSNHGTLTNGPTWSNTSPQGGWGSIAFGGNGLNHSIAATSTLAGPPITMGARFRAEAKGPYYGIISAAGGAILLSGAGGAPLAYIWNGNTSAEYDGLSGLTINVGTWYLAVLTISTTAATLFLAGPDGIISSWTRTATHNARSAATMRLGSDRNVTDHFWNGAISEGFLENRIWTVEDFREYVRLANSGYLGLFNRTSSPFAAFFASATPSFQPAWAAAYSNTVVGAGGRAA